MWLPKLLLWSGHVTWSQPPFPSFGGLDLCKRRADAFVLQASRGEQALGLHRLEVYFFVWFLMAGGLLSLQA